MASLLLDPWKPGNGDLVGPYACRFHRNKIPSLAKVILKALIRGRDPEGFILEGDKTENFIKVLKIAASGIFISSWGGIEFMDFGGNLKDELNVVGTVSDRCHMDNDRHLSPIENSDKLLVVLPIACTEGLSFRVGFATILAAGVNLRSVAAGYVSEPIAAKLIYRHGFPSAIVYARQAGHLIRVSDAHLKINGSIPGW